MAEIDYDAKAYVDLLNSPPNGWGQHVHPHYGQSHHMLRKCYERHGQPAFTAALDAEFKRRRDAVLKVYQGDQAAQG